MISCSNSLCLQLSKNESFFQELVNRLAIEEEDSHSVGRRLKEILELILQLCSISEDGKELLVAFDMYAILVKVLHSAQSEEKVIV